MNWYLLWIPPLSCLWTTLISYAVLSANFLFSSFKTQQVWTPGDETGSTIVGLWMTMIMRLNMAVQTATDRVDNNLPMRRNVLAAEDPQHTRQAQPRPVQNPVHLMQHYVSAYVGPEPRSFNSFKLKVIIITNVTKTKFSLTIWSACFKWRKSSNYWWYLSVISRTQRHKKSKTCTLYSA